MLENDHHPKVSPVRRQMNEQIIQQRNNTSSDVHAEAGGTYTVPHFITYFLNWEDKHLYMLKVNSQWREKKDTRGKGPDEGQFPWREKGWGPELHGGTDMEGQPWQWLGSSV